MYESHNESMHDQRILIFPQFFLNICLLQHARRIIWWQYFLSSLYFVARTKYIEKLLAGGKATIQSINITVFGAKEKHTSALLIISVVIYIFVSGNR